MFFSLCTEGIVAGVKSERNSGTAGTIKLILSGLMLYIPLNNFQHILVLHGLNHRTGTKWCARGQKAVFFSTFQFLDDATI